MGHDLDEVYDAIWAIEKISHKTFDAIIVAEFSVEEAELIVCDIRMQTQQNMYSIILNKEAQHKEHNDYADEVIPLTRPALRDALARKFSGV
ncbi:TPA: hypothetical protein DDX30_04290 [Candidatus Wolfebacteria bacterium]|nr:hypothetical protein [Candidatus Wolfebacteria bacterium]